MEIQVKCRNTERSNVIKNCAQFYSKVLNLENSRYSVEIRSVSGLRATEECNGVVFQIGPKRISMLLDNRLGMTRLLLTLAHEMIHVKQIAKGQYKGKLARNGRVLSCWRGKAVRAEYLKRPWEVEAFKREFNLLETLIEHVAEKEAKLDIDQL